MPNEASSATANGYNLGNMVDLLIIQENFRQRFFNKIFKMSCVSDSVH